MTDGIVGAFRFDLTAKKSSARRLIGSRSSVTLDGLRSTSSPETTDSGAANGDRAANEAEVAVVVGDSALGVDDDDVAIGGGFATVDLRTSSRLPRFARLRRLAIVS